MRVYIETTDYKTYDSIAWLDSEVKETRIRSLFRLITKLVIEFQLNPDTITGVFWGSHRATRFDRSEYRYDYHADFGELDEAKQAYRDTQESV